MNSNQPNTTVYLSNLSYQRDRAGLKSLLAPFGRIKNIKIIVEPTTGQSRGMAFIEMSTAEEAKNILTQMNGRSVDGRMMKVKMATPLKATSLPKIKADAPKPRHQKDLEFKDVQLMKKARNAARKAKKPF